VSDVEERRIGGCLVRIDRSLCVGFAQCVDAAPLAFRLGRDDIVTFDDDTDGVEHELLLEAGDTCPVDAVSVFDVDGKQLAP
jgi:ferredoxin